jgi:hypothetical protein
MTPCQMLFKLPHKNDNIQLAQQHCVCYNAYTMLSKVINETAMERQVQTQNGV